jgi:hypothetical protein
MIVGKVTIVAGNATEQDVDGKHRIKLMKETKARESFDSRLVRLYCPCPNFIRAA